MALRSRRKAYIAPLVVVEPSKFGPDAVLVLECDDHWPHEDMARLKASAEEAFGMKVVILDGVKVARVDCGVMKKRRRWR